jgi:toxin ParE1/3/4
MPNNLLPPHAQLQSLKHYPDLGRLLPEFPGSGIREIFVDSFRLLYRVLYDDVEIVGIIHMARDITNIEPSD